MSVGICPFIQKIVSDIDAGQEGLTPIFVLAHIKGIWWV